MGFPYLFTAFSGDIKKNSDNDQLKISELYFVSPTRNLKINPVNQLIKKSGLMLAQHLLR